MPGTILLRPSARTPARPHRHPAVGLAAVIVLTLLAAFFAWQSAEPLWLALGRGEPGTATVTRCDPATGEPTAAGTVATTYQCVVFEAADGSYRATDVTLLGAGGAARTEAARLPARMISAEDGRAYAASAAGLHLRWVIGLALVLACGAGIAWTSGATRLDHLRQRRIGVALSFAGPLLITAGFVVASF